MVEALENYVIFNTFKKNLPFTLPWRLLNKSYPQTNLPVSTVFYCEYKQYRHNEDNSVLVRIETNQEHSYSKSYKEKLMKDINLIIK